MIRYNDIEEFNGIQTGDTVFISGLLGKHHSIINNKYGFLKDIYMSHDQKKNKINYVGEIELLSNKEIHFINFDYIFKIGKNLNRNDINSMLWVDDPYTHFIFKKDLIDSHPMIDEHGQILSVGTAKNNTKYVFLFSGVN
jgi:hypothetical protein